MRFRRNYVDSRALTQCLCAALHVQRSEVSHTRLVAEQSGVLHVVARILPLLD